MAGTMISFSSLPINPPSPACGLRLSTAMRGSRTEKSWISDCRSSRNLVTIRCLVTDALTSETGI